MQKQKGIQCCHKIKQFQFHKGCFNYAGICKEQCQKLHDGDVNIMSIDAIQDHFQGIRQHIIKQIKKYGDKLKQSYNLMIYELQKQQNENVKQMQKEMLNQLIKNIQFDKSIIDKIENKRYERIRCHQLRNFMDESNIQQKIKKSAHITVYHKYQSIVENFKDKFFKFSTQLIQSKNPTQYFNKKNVNNNILHTNNHKSQDNSVPSKPESKGQQKSADVDKASKLPYYFQKQKFQQEQQKAKNFQQKFRLLERQYKELQSELRKKKFENSCLITEKKNLERVVNMVPQRKKPNLKRGTWNIFKLHTKKIKKQAKVIDIEVQSRQRQSQHHENMQVQQPEPQQQLQPEQINISGSESQQNLSIQQSPQKNNAQRPQIPQTFQEPVQRNNNSVQQPQKIPAICMQATKPMPIQLDESSQRVEEEDKKSQGEQQQQEQISQQKESLNQDVMVAEEPQEQKHYNDQNDPENRQMVQEQIQEQVQNNQIQENERKESEKIIQNQEIHIQSKANQNEVTPPTSIRKQLITQTPKKAKDSNILSGILSSFFKK